MKERVCNEHCPVSFLTRASVCVCVQREPQEADEDAPSPDQKTKDRLEKYGGGRHVFVVCTEIWLVLINTTQL